MASNKQLPIRTFRFIDELSDQRLVRLAETDRRKVAQMARLIIEDGLNAMEKKLGLPPIDKASEASSNEADHAA
ncbi:hypothetical protein [Endozoicomonas ascidiicola]|uniref:hypothetical protein n=1 Tax=Endozoicomonas ascidiicola TaxID=1698521 RepID=UPI0008350EDA|nr:hypothetical protein [Endozoicomonas ascidiicola]